MAHLTQFDSRQFDSSDKPLIANDKTAIEQVIGNQPAPPRPSRRRCGRAAARRLIRPPGGACSKNFRRGGTPGFRAAAPRAPLPAWFIPVSGISAANQKTRVTGQGGE